MCGQFQAPVMGVKFRRQNYENNNYCLLFVVGYVVIPKYENSISVKQQGQYPTRDPCLGKGDTTIHLVYIQSQFSANYLFTFLPRALLVSIVKFLLKWFPGK